MGDLSRAAWAYVRAQMRVHMSVHPSAREWRGKGALAFAGICSGTHAAMVLVMPTETEAQGGEWTCSESYNKHVCVPVCTGVCLCLGMGVCNGQGGAPTL